MRNNRGGEETERNETCRGREIEMNRGREDWLVGWLDFTACQPLGYFMPENVFV